jgi:hypothetical protein
MDLAKDGGLIFAGNNELNGEDYFMIKLHPDCDWEEDYTYTNGHHFINTGGGINYIIWNSDKYIKGTIIIDNNVTLEISGGAQIYFADTRHTMDFDVLATNNFTTGQTPTKIIVKPGGKLVIDGGTDPKTTLQGLPNCDNMWEGIEVWGNPNLNQNGSGNQGYLEIKNGAILKDMFKGVTVGKTEYPAKQNILEFGSYPSNTNTDGGGIVKVPGSGATFLNNRISVSFAPYYWNKVQQTKFENTDFICNDYLKDVNFISDFGQRLGQEEHILMNDLFPFQFNTCNFTGYSAVPFPDINMPDYNFWLNQNKGIWEFDAAPHVRNGTFEELYVGIYGSYSINTPAKALNSKVNKFYNCYTGIELHGGMSSKIKDDRYEIDNVTGEDRFGIITRCATNFMILDSDFIGMGTAGATTSSIGILTEECGSNASHIFGNTFENLFIGDQTQQDCGTTATGGLNIKCNSYDNMEATAWAIAPAGGGSLPNQGMPCAASAKIAGNAFIDPSCTAPITDFYHINSTVNFDYYGTTSASNWMPTCINSLVTGTNCFSNYNSNTSCQHPCPSCNSNQLRAAMDTARVYGNMAEYEFLRDDLIRYYYNLDQPDSVIWILQSDTSLKARKMLIGVYLSEEMVENARELLEGLPDNDCSRLLAQIQIAAIGEDSRKSLGDPEFIQEYLESLYELANSGNVCACNARAILENFYGYSFEKTVERLGERGRSGNYNTGVSKPDQLLVYPNPFSEFTTIEYSVSSVENSWMIIYDVTGKAVKKIKLDKETGTFEFNGKDLNNGIYFCQLLSNGEIMQTTKLVLTK